MTNNRVWRALVVDDEAIMRRLLHRALCQEGFVCDFASDGKEALQMAAANNYDAVVTDLRMPNQHGHALATHLLAAERRPVVVVHTGVIEPKLAKDLIVRGVDDILFKPTDFSVLAAKVKALVKRRSETVRDCVMPEAASISPAAESPDSATIAPIDAAGESSVLPRREMSESPQSTKPSETRPVDAQDFRGGWSLLQWLFN